MTHAYTIQCAGSLLDELRAAKPLVHNVTNFVAMNMTANVLLALGASPVMSHAPEEAAEMVGLARAVVLNIGTLSSAWVDCMQRVQEQAIAAGKPVVIDPVGAGATRYRTDTAQHLLAAAPGQIVRGNASEICALAGSACTTYGVDSSMQAEAALDAAFALAQRHDCIVCISGPIDYIVARQQGIGIEGGCPMMPLVTGMGCTASAVVGAFAGLGHEPFVAVAEAMAVMATAGAMAGAGAGAQGPGSFFTAFVDAMYLCTRADVQREVHIRSL